MRKARSQVSNITRTNGSNYSDELLKDMQSDTDFQELLEEWVQEESQQDQIRILQESGVGTFNEFITTKDNFSELVKELDIEVNPKSKGGQFLDWDDEEDSDEEWLKNMALLNEVPLPRRKPTGSLSSYTFDDKDSNEDDELPFYLKPTFPITNEQIKLAHNRLRELNKVVKRRNNAELNKLSKCGPKGIVIPEMKKETAKTKKNQGKIIIQDERNSRRLRNELILED